MTGVCGRRTCLYHPPNFCAIAEQEGFHSRKRFLISCGLNKTKKIASGPGVFYLYIAETAVCLNNQTTDANDKSISAPLAPLELLVSPRACVGVSVKSFVQTAGAHAAEKSDDSDDAADAWSELITCLEATGFGRKP